MLKPYLEKLIARRDLSAAETTEMLMLLASGNTPTFQAGAVLAALRMKGESVTELTAGAELLRRHARRIDCGRRDCVDIVGTGGDGGISFNISTTAAIVAAGAGVSVAKHGNRAVSGKSGAADMMAALGYNLDAAPEEIEECIATHGIGFLFAPKLHPLLAKVAPMRRELGVRTMFNMLGPLCNPGGVRRMVVGVYDRELTELFGETLHELGVKRAMIVHGADGLDEISCCAPTRVTELRDGNLQTYDLYPEILLGASYDPAEISGGTPQDNAALAMEILSGRNQGAPRAVVLLNAAAACCVADLADSMPEAMRLAGAAIDSGRALAKLNAMCDAVRPPVAPDILQRIVVAARPALADAKKQRPLAQLEREIKYLPPRPSFAAAMRRDGVNIIAELKKASPSRGVIRSDFQPTELARELADNGAAALSVLTESNFFLGGMENLRLAAATNLPLLCKDFIEDEYRIYQAKIAGASAILLIGALLPAAKLRDLAACAAALQLDVLGEAHNEAELDMLLESQVTLIGVNARDLKSFVCSPERSAELLRRIPPERLPIAESAITSRADIATLRRAGATGFLIGETLMRAPRPGQFMRENLL